ncbi:MAG TPA: NB-ARC domain-containing protein [Burkholderiaceae bacterium]|nr:NB-ARC domain-containing protein [Burkholderiaceae bacterium]
MPNFDPLALKIFVSSPGDVGQERAIAREIISGMANEPLLRGKVMLEPVDYAHPSASTPMEARTAPQASVNEFKGCPADCDLTIVILWSRLGSPARGVDGTRYTSGTVWEYENALTGRGPVWVYRRTTEPMMAVNDPKADEKRAQYGAVQTFFERFSDAEGALTGGFTRYDKPEEFGRLLHQHLEAFIGKRLETLTPDPSRPAQTGPVVPYLVPHMPRPYTVVGRERVLAKMWRAISAGQNCSLVFLAGVGKTTAAVELLRRRKDDVLTEFPGGVLWADIGRHLQLQVQLRSWAQALGVPSWQLAAATSDDDFKRLVSEALGQRRALMVLDDVWQAADALQMMELGPQCVSIVTTRLKRVAEELSAEENVTRVDELGEEDGLKLLREIAPHAVGSDPAAARALVSSVQGLPLALVLAARFLKRESGDRDPDRIREAFETLRQAGSLPPGEDRGVREIIDVSVAALHSDAARRTLENLSIFRPKPHRITKAMAHEVCDAPNASLYELSDMGLIESCGDGDYSMHRIVTEYAREKLPAERRRDLHRRALAWYGAQLSDDVKGDPDAYLDWYRYEQPEWQATKDAWLYHLAASGDEIGSTLAFLRVYFDAFWWWGYYQQFPFCERMIREWSARDVGPGQRDGLRQLAAFSRAYPAGREKHVDPARWKTVREALDHLRRALKLEGSFDTIAGIDSRRVRAYTDFFLAEAFNYGEGDFRNGLALYRDAHDELVTLSDLWSAAYVSYYMGQVLLERGDADAARRQAEIGLDEAHEEAPLSKRDPELLAHHWRLLGDARLARGEVQSALASMKRSAFYAFAFQAIPKSADTYTVAFYCEITQRIAASVSTLLDEQPAAGMRLAKGLQAAWGPWWERHERLERTELTQLRRGDIRWLVRCLFPVVPPEEEVSVTGAEFALQVREVIEPLRTAAGIRAN